MTTEKEIQDWLDLSHPQHVYQCDYCGRLHRADANREEFVTLVGGFLDGCHFPSQKKLQPIVADSNGQPNVLIICKRFSCLIKFMLSVLHMKNSWSDPARRESLGG